MILVGFVLALFAESSLVVFVMMCLTMVGVFAIFARIVTQEMYSVRDFRN